MGTLARSLRERREAADLTQAQLAERAGLSRALVSAVERGRHSPRIGAALSLAAALGTTVEELFADGPRGPVDALTGAPPERGAPVRLGRVGRYLVTAPPRLGDAGWEPLDGVVGSRGLERFDEGGAVLVVAGCDPALVLLERLLRERGTRTLAIEASSAAALRALEADRVHAAAVHFPDSAPPSAAPSVGGAPLFRVGLARWRVGLAAPKGAGRGWWRSALVGRVPVVQREPGAAAQRAFERAAERAGRPIEGPRVGGHLAASRHCVVSGLPAVTIEPAAAAVGARFHPLETHAVELWVRAERAGEPAVQRLLEQLNASITRRTLECVGGYDVSATGSRLA